MRKKIRVAVIFGGTNTEHEVSLRSAKSIIENLDPAKYEITPIKITKDNRWVTTRYLPRPTLPELETAETKNRVGELTTFEGALTTAPYDVVFPVLHGPYGEDGTVQGMLELMRLPYVGCGVTASAVCMDKVLQKNICRDYGIPVPAFYWFTKYQWDHDRENILITIKNKLGEKYPLFVKPANQGSSVGVSKVSSLDMLVPGIEEALLRDTKIIVEEGVANAREIECSVLGNHAPKASVLGEIIPHAEFYDYETKYINDNSEAVIPAELEKELTEKIRNTAVEAFRALSCSGLARVDFLIDGQNGNFYLNELNTMPGFTEISMYPKLWIATGVKYPELLDSLVGLAIEKSQEQSSLSFNL